MSKTQISTIPSLIAPLRKSYKTLKPIQARKDALLALYNLLNENKSLLFSAVHSDLGKSPHETSVYELGPLMSEIADAIHNVSSWAATSYPSTSLYWKLDTCAIDKVPKGVVLIIGAWNYPLSLLFGPMIGALSAGNACVLKPSELSSNTAQAITQLIPRYFDSGMCAVVNGSANATTALLKEKFDHIFYTGGSRVGRIVMKAAAENLTPVTLELGGKSPCIVSSKADICVAARRIAWGKGLNCGQTCVAPDYVLCVDSVVDEFVRALETCFTEYYGLDVKRSDSYGRIVNHGHWKRLMGLIRNVEGRIVFGGEYDEEDLFISPTVVKDVDADDDVMKEEIFGPILPIIKVESVQEAVEIINKRPHPLSLYVFSGNRQEQEYVRQHTQSGGMVVNDVVVHLGVACLPFGGIGESGMGSYHGIHGFNTFTHMRTVVIRSQNRLLEWANALRIPPYSATKEKWVWCLVFSRIRKDWWWIRWFMAIMALSWIL